MNMDTEKLNRIEETLIEIRIMADSGACFENKGVFAEKLRALSLLERGLAGNAASETEEELCRQIRGIVKAAACAFLPVDG